LRILGLDEELRENRGKLQRKIVGNAVFFENSGKFRDFEVSDQKSGFTTPSCMWIKGAVKRPERAGERAAKVSR
jgi:hypothetical protein